MAIQQYKTHSIILIVSKKNHIWKKKKKTYINHLKCILLSEIDNTKERVRQNNLT